ncbi:MAG: 30S ribosome-binding factor RbfA [Nitrospira sp. SB0666_bin_27]|nr:30S ribosome-binding factor RbfA [Nitrospira sp. SB0666_bin_27]
MEVADILARKCKDPRLKFVTVTDVEMNNDLRKAYVYVSLLGNHVDTETVGKILDNASGFVRLELGRRLELRYTPEVSFWFDSSGSRGDKIDRLLDAMFPDGQSGEEGQI